MTPTLILGIGNLLMGDEGVGVHAIRALATAPWPPGVCLVDGGTGGFHLLGYLTEYRRVVLVDAATDGAPAGTVTVRRPEYASDCPPSLTAHDIGLRDLIESAALLGPLPDLTLVTVSIAGVQPLATRLSPPVSAALPAVERAVREALAAPAVCRA